MSIPALFQPIRIGNVTLKHRVVLAPMTRLRNSASHVPTDLVVEHYSQRASVPGTLLITEAAYIAPQASGQPFAPGIWNDAQTAGWKRVVDAVHSEGSYIYLQLWALGRAARPAMLHKEFPDYPYVSASPIPLSERPDDVPRALTQDEIKEYMKWYAEAAANAVHKAGFDGVEVHGANGYLIDQFLQDVTNKRTDSYGGSVENRARFALEVMDAIVAAVGESKAAIRLSPWSRYQDMRMDDAGVITQFSYVVNELKRRHPNLAFLHTVAPTSFGNEGPKNAENADFIHKLWAPRPLITTGGFTREMALKTAETGQIVGFGQLFLANPDLPFRLREDLPLNTPDMATFYTQDANGYNTYPFHEKFSQARSG